MLSNAVVGKSISGILGLGTNRGVSSNANATQIYKPTFLDSIPGQWLDANPTAANFTFGMTIKPPLVKPQLVDSNASISLPSNRSAGILHWLQTDTSFYQQDQLSYANVDTSLATSVVTTTGPQDWLFPLDGWLVTTARGSVGNQTQLIANVDILHQGIYIPLRDAELMYVSIPESYPLSTTSTFGALSQSWSVPCDAEFTLGITIGLRTFTLDSRALVIRQPDGSCVGAIEGWKDPKVTQYLLGARFLSSLYVIFIVQPNGPSLIGFSIIAENIVISPSSSHLGVIVGGTIGGLALLLLSVFIIWWCCIRPQSSTAYATNLDERQRPTTFDIAPYPFMVSRFPNEPLYSGAQKIAWNPGSTTTGSSSQATFASDRSDYTANLLRPPRSSPRAHRDHFCRNHHKAAIDRPPPAYDDAGRRAGVVRKPLEK
ncbi:hypothetical protein NLI96_g2777 [Meripilus lineatus]|uniref:Peptidase A1 domain-containing protein n=1 Tax=Meripilus lineatus TaxID=2056292 RepID=A0AAD5V802_9APHY|nr:hypothetical protein NLI96_g2777 [Physisporinus lineatus]